MAVRCTARDIYLSPEQARIRDNTTEPLADVRQYDLISVGGLFGDAVNASASKITPRSSLGSDDMRVI